MSSDASETPRISVFVSDSANAGVWRRVAGGGGTLPLAIDGTTVGRDVTGGGGGANGAGVDVASVWSDTNGASRAITSRVVAIRCADSLAIMSAMTSTNSELRLALSRRGSKGRRSQCARALSAVVPPGKGTFPVTA